MTKESEIIKDYKITFKEQQLEIRDLKETNIFWDAINADRIQFDPKIKENVHFQIDLTENMVYLKLNEIFLFYTEYCFKTKIPQLDKGSLKKHLKALPSFRPGKQESRSGYAYTKANFGSCYRFQILKTNERSVVLIDNKEVRLGPTT